jgi:hypothetical protein
MSLHNVKRLGESASADSMTMAKYQELFKKEGEEVLITVSL